MATLKTLTNPHIFRRRGNMFYVNECVFHLHSKAVGNEKAHRLAINCGLNSKTRHPDQISIRILSVCCLLLSSDTYLVFFPSCKIIKFMAKLLPFCILVDTAGSIYLKWIFKLRPWCHWILDYSKRGSKSFEIFKLLKFPLIKNSPSEPVFSRVGVVDL